MDKENLYKLKKLAINLSILYIEDDTALQNKVGGFLNKLFDNFYCAFDGNDALKQYKNKQPDIVLTTLEIPKKNGFDLVVDIKGENPDVKIVILSYDNEDLELLQTIDIGIVDFLIKPLDINTLLDSLLVAISQVHKQDIDTRCIEDLKIAKEQKSKIDFFSSYKGVSIHKDGELKEIKDDEFIVTVPSALLVAMRNAKNTIINLKSLDKYIRANVFDIDKENSQVTLINPHYVSYRLIELQQKRIKIDKNFKVGLYFRNIAIEAKIIDISFTSITIYIDKLVDGLKLNSKVDLTLGVYINSANRFIKEKRFAKVFSQGQILKIEPFDNGYKILSLLKIQKSSQRILSDYLKQREIEIINEFKYIIQKDM